MIPYLDIPTLRIGPLEVHAFGALAATAVATGYFWMVQRVRRLGLDSSLIHGLAFWVFSVGFPVSVVVKWLYMPGFWHTLSTAPGDLIRGGVVMSSFGGVFGGMAAAIVYLWATGNVGTMMWRYVDVIAYCFPRAFIFGRIGCYIAHDHPGIRTSSWLGVQYPGGTRFDLGLLEAMFLVLVVGVLGWLDRRKRPAGFFLGVFLIVYGVFRFALDRLHEDPPRYYGVTLDQWFSVGAIIAGTVALFIASRRGSTVESASRSLRHERPRKAASPRSSLASTPVRKK